MVLTGGPEGLEVLMTRRAALPEACHASIEADTPVRHQAPLTGRTLPGHGEDPPHPEQQLLWGKAGQCARESRQVASAFTGEEEYILVPGTQLKVTEVKAERGGLCTV
ncbi:hypothetical protein ACWEQU_28775, partial [Streptomyces nodosus]